MPLEPAFVDDCPYGPGGLLMDEVLRIDRDANLVVARMPTFEDLPLTREQRAHPTRHPRHVSGGLMVHMTGMVAFVHAYYVLDLRPKNITGNHVSAMVTTQVLPAAALSVTSSTPNASYGTPVTLTATVSPSNAAGRVTFTVYPQKTVVGSATTNASGVATSGTFTANGVSELHAPRLNDWGPSVSVNGVFGPSDGPSGRRELEVEMQSGDRIRIVAASFDFPPASDAAENPTFASAGSQAQ